MTANMVFGIGSVTKTLRATLTMKLVEEVLLSLEDTPKKGPPDSP